MQKIFLIDNSYFIYRSFYAIKELRTSAGFPTNAIYGFAVMLIDLICSEKPDYIASASDLPAKTFRHNLYPEYKATRAHMPEELQKQIPVIKEVLRFTGIRNFQIEGYEADDIIGTLAKTAADKGFAVSILARDKDYFQLVNNSVKIIHGKDSPHYGIEEIKARFNVAPEQLVDVWALSGDTSDNIPGVPGIGKKTAAKLIQQFGSFEKLLQNLENIGNKRVKLNLKTFSRQAKLSKQLVKIDCNVPIECDIIKDCRFKQPDKVNLRKLFKHLEFEKLLDRIESMA